VSKARCASFPARRRTDETDDRIGTCGGARPARQAAGRPRGLGTRAQAHSRSIRRGCATPRAGTNTRRNARHPFSSPQDRNLCLSHCVRLRLLPSQRADPGRALRHGMAPRRRRPDPGARQRSLARSVGLHDRGQTMDQSRVALGSAAQRHFSVRAFHRPGAVRRCMRRDHCRRPDGRLPRQRRFRAVRLHRRPVGVSALSRQSACLPCPQ